MKPFYTEETNTIFDKKTGEVMSATTKVRKVAAAASDEPPYAKLYFDHLLEFSGGLKSASNLLMDFCQIMSYGSDPDGSDANLVYINAAFIKNYTKRHHCTRDAYYKQLKSLTDANIVKRVDRGTYQVNPNLVGKGDWIKNGIKHLRATFDYVDGTVSTEIEAGQSEEPQPITTDLSPVDGQMSIFDKKTA